MQVDQARDQGLAGQGDALGVGRGGHTPGRADFLDAAVFHQHRPARARLAVAGPDAVGGEKDAARLGGVDRVGGKGKQGEGGARKFAGPARHGSLPKSCEDEMIMDDAALAVCLRPRALWAHP